MLSTTNGGVIHPFEKDTCGGEDILDRNERENHVYSSCSTFHTWREKKEEEEDEE